MIKKDKQRKKESERKQQIKKIGNKHGSLLLEIAIALSIIGLISAFFMTRGITIRRTMQEQKIKNNIEITTSALAAYLAANNRLPRPALTNTNGFESANVDLAIGNIPFNTLGIAEKNTLDRNGRALIYIVEPRLTNNIFDRIYDDENRLDENYFCADIVSPKIKIAERNATAIQRAEENAERNHNNDVIAFVIDTADNPPEISGGKIFVKPSVHTSYVRRNFILIHYMKSCPCEARKRQAGFFPSSFPSAFANEHVNADAHEDNRARIEETDPFAD